MKIYTSLKKNCYSLFFIFALFSLPVLSKAQTLAFPEAEGFGRYATGARGVSNPEIYSVTNLNDSGPGSFRDGVSKPGRFIVFNTDGVIRLKSKIAVAENTTIAGQTAPGEGVVLYGRSVTFTGSHNTIARYLRIRLGANAGAGSNDDASGISNGTNIILDHMSISWGLDEVFSINWDRRGDQPDNITVQNSIIGQGLHQHNHSAGGLIQTEKGKISLLRNLYTSNKTRNPKVKGVNEFINNVVYNYGNVGNQKGHKVSGDGYIMGGSAGVSEVNIINNYFIAGPLTPKQSTPFSRGTPTFFLYASGNHFDNNKNGKLDGKLIPYNSTGYPGLATKDLKTQPFDYPTKNPALSAKEAYAWIIDHAGANFPKRDKVDELMIDELSSKGTKGIYLFSESDLPLSNGGLGMRISDKTPLKDTDGDGIPDIWEDKLGLDKNNKNDALTHSITHPEYLNIEVYINSLVKDIN